jgi:hypothetical protein
MCRAQLASSSSDYSSLSGRCFYFANVSSVCFCTGLKAKALLKRMTSSFLDDAQVATLASYSLADLIGGTSSALFLSLK